jgi:DNA-binding response OmpR family regulator
MSERTATVLVVDDEPDIVELMRDFLEADGFSVMSAGDGPSALSLLRTEMIDCVLLDVMMPELTGFETLRRIRMQDEIPVLFLTAKQEDSDKIRGLGLGADDYIVKSASPAEVVARVKAVLRRVKRGGPAPDRTLDFGRLKIDVQAREVFIDGNLVQLTTREFDLLQFLAEHPRQVLTRDALYERLWGPYGDRHTLTVHIGRLREKIEADPAQPKFLVTVWGVGYRFEGEHRT